MTCFFLSILMLTLWKALSHRFGDEHEKFAPAVWGKQIWGCSRFRIWWKHLLLADSIQSMLRSLSLYSIFTKQAWTKCISHIMSMMRHPHHPFTLHIWRITALMSSEMDGRCFLGAVSFAVLHLLGAVLDQKFQLCPRRRDYVPWSVALGSLAWSKVTDTKLTCCWQNPVLSQLWWWHQGKITDCNRTHRLPSLKLT